MTQSAFSKLLQLSWPGNVRELENTLERAVVLSDQEWITEEDLFLEGIDAEAAEVQTLFLKLLTLENLEKQYIRYVLKITNNTKEKAAEILGINRKTLYKKNWNTKLQIRLIDPCDSDTPHFAESMFGFY